MIKLRLFSEWTEVLSLRIVVFCINRMRSLSRINVGLRFANFIGFVLALYAFIVETSKESDPSYTAMCDINEHMSCSRVFTSK